MQKAFRTSTRGNSAATSESWLYDRDHNNITFTDQNQTVHTHTFDGANRKIQSDVRYASGNPHQLVGTTQKTCEFDGLNRKTRCTDNNEPSDPEDDVVCTYAYDMISRVLEESCQIGTLPMRTVSHYYEGNIVGAGNLQPTAMVYPDGRVLVYSYDKNNRRQTIGGR